MNKQLKLNRRLLRKVRNRIAEIPESYYQGQFVKVSEQSPCGAAACLAGETIICSRPTVKQGLASLWASMRRFRRADSVYETNVGQRAAKLLGLNADEANAMFEGWPARTWPAPFGERYANANREGLRAKVAVAYLDECLRLGKVIW